MTAYFVRLEESENPIPCPSKRVLKAHVEHRLRGRKDFLVLGHTFNCSRCGAAEREILLVEVARVRNHPISCPSRRVLQAHADGRLGYRKGIRVSWHTANCEACAQVAYPLEDKAWRKKLQRRMRWSIFRDWLKCFFLE